MPISLESKHQKIANFNVREPFKKRRNRTCQGTGGAGGTDGGNTSDTH